MGASMMPEPPAARIARNVAALRAQGATEHDVEAYLTEHEGLTPSGPAAPVSDGKPHGSTGTWGDDLGDKVRGTINAVGQGMLPGFADEFNAKFSPGDYNENVKREREDMAAFGRAHPAINLAGKVAGTALTASLPIVRGLGIIGGGAVFGAAQGAGDADGSLKDRAIGAGIGAGVGAASGAALQHVVGPVARMGYDVAKAGAAKIAESPLAKGLTDFLAAHPPGLSTQDVAGLTPGSNPPPNATRGVSGGLASRVEDLLPRSADDRAKMLMLQKFAADKKSVPDLIAAAQASTKPLGAADLAGDNTMGLARAARAVPGDAKDAIPKAIYARADGQPLRVRGDIERAAGTSAGDVLAKADELIAQQKANAKPLYEKAYADAPIDDPAVHETLKVPQFRAAYNRGRRIALIEGVDLPALPGEASSRAASGPPASVTVRDAYGRLRQNLSNVPDEHLEDEWRRLAEMNSNEEALHAGVQEAGYRADYEELPRTEKLGRKGQEDLPDADGTMDPDVLAGDNKIISDYRRSKIVRAARSKAMDRIQAELAGRPSVDDFSFGANVAPAAESATPSAASKPIPIQGIDYMKRGLDDLVESKIRGGTMGRTEARALRNRLGDMLDVVDQQRPNYGAARAQFRGDAQLRDALDQGREFSKTDDRAIGQILAKMSPGERQLYAQGALDDLTQQIRGTTDGHDAVQRVFGNDLKREALKALVGPDSFAQLESAMNDETRMLRTKRFVLGGSNTVDKAGEVADMGGGKNPWVQEMIHRGPVRGSLSALTNSTLANRAAGVTTETANALSPLFTKGMGGSKQELIDMLTDFLAAQSREAQRGQTRSIVSRPFTSAAGGAASSFTSPPPRR